MLLKPLLWGPLKTRLTDWLNVTLTLHLKFHLVERFHLSSRWITPCLGHCELPVNICRLIE